MNEPDKTHEVVRNAYADVARKQASCCSTSAKPSCSCRGGKQPYVVPDHPIPESELGLSCGNPVAFGYINPGDVVVDLGSGAGKDVFLAAQKVGPAGRTIGIDMTPEMVALAHANALKFFATTGLSNVEFHEAYIEDLPLGDASADVVISNCVINLSPDKPKVFREVYRILKASGRMIVSDIVLNRPLPPQLKDNAELYSACVAGALQRDDYIQAVCAAGFTDVTILADHTYAASNACNDPMTSGVADLLTNLAAAITVLAKK